MTAPVKLAVITGGHSFHVPDFHELFRRLEGVTAYVQCLDDFASSPTSVRHSYHAVLFYIMLMETPKDEELPWHAGKPLTALTELGETDQGIVLLHHALLAYPHWPLWDELVGISGRSFGFYVNQAVRSQIESPDHPITMGLEPWEMTDETYTMPNAEEGNELLLTYDHPRSMRTIAWTRQHKQARVFCYQAGHDKAAYSDANFQEVLRRGILWTARSL
jgi:hypothetical protein